MTTSFRVQIQSSGSSLVGLVSTPTTRFLCVSSTDISLADVDEHGEPASQVIRTYAAIQLLRLSFLDNGHIRMTFAQKPSSTQTANMVVHVLDDVETFVRCCKILNPALLLDTEGTRPTRGSSLGMSSGGGSVTDQRKSSLLLQETTLQRVTSRVLEETTIEPEPFAAVTTTNTTPFTTGVPTAEQPKRLSTLGGSVTRDAESYGLPHQNSMESGSQDFSNALMRMEDFEEDNDSSAHEARPPPASLCTTFLTTTTPGDSSLWYRFFVKWRNRYGCFQGMTLFVSPSGEEFHLQDRIPKYEGQNATAPPTSAETTTTTTTNDDDDLPAPPPLRMTTSASTTNIASAAPIWVIQTSRIKRITRHGLAGVVVVFTMTERFDVVLAFETCGSREEVLDVVTQTLKPNVPVIRLDHGGEDALSCDIAGPWSTYTTSVVRAMGNVRSARTYVINRLERCLYAFRASDLIGGIVTEDCSSRKGVSAVRGVIVDCGFKSKSKLRWAPVRDDGQIPAKGDWHELQFSSFSERERFAATLHALNSPMMTPLTPARAHRHAWARPALGWFETRKGLFVGTFNVGEASPPPPATLDLWVMHPSSARSRALSKHVTATTKRAGLFGRPSTTTTTTPVAVTGTTEALPSTRMRAKSGSAGITGKFDAYVFGLQECGNKFDEWTKALQTHLGNEYTLVASPRLGSLGLYEMGVLVFVSLAESPHVSCVEFGSVATGKGLAKEVTGMQLGNKGGVGVGLRWHDSSFCFIGAHFAAHQEKIAHRNRDFCQIISKLGLSGLASGFCTGDAQLEPMHAFDHTFFFGDLNYRVDETFQKVISIASRGNWPALLQMDQLRKEIEAGRSFYNFKEAGDPNFPPTYRWERDKRAFSNKRDQPPSYTDRILFTSRSGLDGRIQPTHYGSAQDLMTSDHRPVAATFNVVLKEPYSAWPVHPLVEMRHNKIVGTTAGTPPSPAHSPPQSPGIMAGSEEYDSSELDEALGVLSSPSHHDRPMSLSEGKGDFFLYASPNNNATPPPRMDDGISSPRASAASSGGGSTSATATINMNDATLLLVDEEEQPFLGVTCPGFLPLDMPIKDGALPEIRLSDMLLRLRPHSDLHLSLEESVNTKPPPAFIQLKVFARFATTLENSELVPGCEIHPDDQDKSVEFAHMYEHGRSWGELFYKINSVVSLRPVVWDPCYLSQQHICVAIEGRASSGIRDGTAGVTSVRASGFDTGDGDLNSQDDASSVGFQSSRGGTEDDVEASPKPRPLSIRKTLAAMDGKVRTALRKKSISGLVNNVAAQLSGTGTSVAGQICLPLKGAVEIVRSFVVKNGISAWTKEGMLSIPFTESVVLGGVNVGELTGRLQLVPSDDATFRAMFLMYQSKLRLACTPTSPYVKDQTMARHSHLEAQIEGIGDKKGLTWRRVFCTLETDGVLSLSARTNLRGGVMKDPRLGALQVMDVSQGTHDVTIALAQTADRFYVMEVTGRLLDTGVVATIILSFAEERDKKDWASCLDSVQSARRAHVSIMPQIKAELQKRKELVQQKRTEAKREKAAAKEATQQQQQSKVAFEEASTPPPSTDEGGKKLLKTSSMFRLFKRQTSSSGTAGPVKDAVANGGGAREGGEVDVAVPPPPPPLPLIPGRKSDSLPPAPPPPPVKTYLREEKSIGLKAEDEPSKVIKVPEFSPVANELVRKKSIGTRLKERAFAKPTIKTKPAITTTTSTTATSG